MTSATPRPPAGAALEQLRYRLALLHRQSGEPSYRVVAQRTGAISHMTAGNVLRCESAPAWGPLELVVEVLGGDPEEFRALWIAVRDEVSPLELPTPTAGEEEPEEPPRTAVELSLPDLDAAEEDLQDRAAKRSRREGETRKELLLALEARADLGEHLASLHEQLGRERGRNEELNRRVADLEAERREHSLRIERLQDELREVRDERLTLLESLVGLHARRAELNFTWARDEEGRRQDAEASRRERDLQVSELRERLSAAEGLMRSVLAAGPEISHAREDPPPSSSRDDRATS
ncbi:hypothetical protein [Streptomyces sp. NPDC046853]|uniref:hypothetical protein n=1 Tax=unclassified Streptomyces TaxID=2593676 RepID=UPI0033CE7274